MGDNVTFLEKKRKRGIYLLPNILTTFGLFAGFYAIILAVNGYYEQSAIAVFVAILFDGLDGRVARLTQTQSTFGAEYDSMSDMLSFSIAPALLAYVWALNTLGKFGWLVSFLYVASGALRLARFNTQIGTQDKNYFQGLPSPSAAGLVASFVWFSHNYELTFNSATLITWLIIFIVALLMVSNIRYHSFKSFNLKGRSSFKIMLLSVFVIVLISLRPPEILFSFFLIYSISGVVITIFGLRKKHLEKIHKKAKITSPDI